MGDASRQQKTNVSESPGLKIEQQVVDDPTYTKPHRQEEERGTDQKEGAPGMATSDTGGVKITSSVEEEEPPKSGHPSLIQKLKEKKDHLEGSMKGREDGLENDPNPELAYEKAAVADPSKPPGMISKVKQTLGMDAKSSAADKSKEDEALSKDLEEKLDLKSSSQSAPSHEGDVVEGQNEQPGFLRRLAQKIGLSSPKS